MKHNLKKIKPVALVILDGFGYREDTKHNAIAHAKKPHFETFLKTYPWKQLQASGVAVGLLPGMMGNSEVGHMTIGFGRAIKQMVVRISEAIKDGSFFTNTILQNSLKALVQEKKTLHIMGLLSNVGVHAHSEHMFAFIDAAVQAGVQTIWLHPFLDGRDTPPQSAQQYLVALEQYCAKYNNVQIGSITGRFYAMDRDDNWERTQITYDMLTQKNQLTFNSWQNAVAYYYKENIFDEFVPPTLLHGNATVCTGDGIIFTNFRADRARQLTEAFVAPDFTHFQRKQIDLTFFITSVAYRADIATTHLYEPELLTDTLKRALDSKKVTMFSVAETEKYAHVTYFLNGGIEENLAHETRVLVPSIPARNYVELPCMSADKITEAVVVSLEYDTKQFYLINYANADMVGHSGDFDATVKAVECVDKQLGILHDEIVIKRDGVLFITADHGNAELMFDEVVCQPHTAHTTNPVYFIACGTLFNNRGELNKMAGLADIRKLVEELFE